MMKNDVYFIVTAPPAAETFKILTHANEMTCDVILWPQSDVKLQKI